MYPFLKLAITLNKARFRSRLELEDTGILHSWAGVTDVDPFMELNHARQILYMELGRWDYSERAGFIELLKKNKWGLTVGGISIRYRRPVPFLKSFTVTTRPICHDSRWFYFLQEILRGDRICTSALVKPAAGTADRPGSGGFAIRPPPALAEPAGENGASRTRSTSRRLRRPRSAPGHSPAI
jgi:acyl-CoA thioesterase FadM